MNKSMVNVLLLTGLLFSNGSANFLPLLPNQAHLDQVLPTLGGPYSDAYRALENSSFAIPKIFWITAKNASGYPREERLQRKHKLWRVNVVNDYYIDFFMEKVFANTSVLWAYKALNPLLGACRADIWRYSVAYVYGGAYIDADAGFAKSLDRYIRPTDAFILGTENNFMRTCYRPEYTRMSKTRKLFNDRIILQWMFISAPRHQFLEQTLFNVVDILWREYHGKSIVTYFDESERFFHIICSTGPGPFTAAIRQVIEQAGVNESALAYRFAGIDFKEVGGKYKWAEKGWNNNPDHYTHHINRGSVILSRYADGTNGSWPVLDDKAKKLEYEKEQRREEVLRRSSNIRVQFHKKHHAEGVAATAVRLARRASPPPPPPPSPLPPNKLDRTAKQKPEEKEKSPTIAVAASSVSVEQQQQLETTQIHTLPMASTTSSSLGTDERLQASRDPLDQTHGAGATNRKFPSRAFGTGHGAHTGESSSRRNEEGLGSSSSSSKATTGHVDIGPSRSTPRSHRKRAASTTASSSSSSSADIGSQRVVVA